MLLLIRRCSYYCTRTIHCSFVINLDIQKQLNKTVQMTPPVVYQTLESILNVFNNPEYRDGDAVKSLLKIYNDVKREQQMTEERRHPLIVIEGLDGTGKTTITKKLSNKIGAKLFCTPPPCMHAIRNLFDDDELLRTAYYALGNYVAAMQMLQMLKHTPVILDRFWHSTTAYALAQAVNENPFENKLPSAGNDIYCWPEDLLKPDIVLLLTVSEDVRVQRQSRRQTVTIQEQLLKANLNFRENVITAYKNMRDPPVDLIDGNPYPKKVVEAIIEKIKLLLK